MSTNTKNIIKSFKFNIFLWVFYTLLRSNIATSYCKAKFFHCNLRSQELKMLFLQNMLTQQKTCKFWALQCIEHTILPYISKIWNHCKCFIMQDICLETFSSTTFKVWFLHHYSTNIKDIYYDFALANGPLNDTICNISVIKLCEIFALKVPKKTLRQKKN